MINDFEIRVQSMTYRHTLSSQIIYQGVGVAWNETIHKTEYRVRNDKEYKYAME